ncbi:MAG: NADPH-dependent 7-cyano-7-deazaguanine reductase QueF [Candidatus Sumerlaeia bacterium]|nr:NADPH-dependent 7-cyano-7-deazaguanine reductase QueF [Candidatus Sumerlaeia bacterium]
MPEKRHISDTTGITMLGSNKSEVSFQLEAFPFKQRNRDTIVTFRCAEFTCHCPVTGQPDFATLDIEYVPAEKGLESKSLKNFLWSYRDTQGFHEDVVNEILDKLRDFLEPKWIRVTGHFNIRGGIAIDVVAEEGTRPA